MVHPTEIALIIGVVCGAIFAAGLALFVILRFWARANQPSYSASMVSPTGTELNQTTETAFTSLNLITQTNALTVFDEGFQSDTAFAE
jgi:glycerol uptake facilitator-like aquaporin